MTESHFGMLLDALLAKVQAKTGSIQLRDAFIPQTLMESSNTTETSDVDTLQKIHILTGIIDDYIKLKILFNQTLEQAKRDAMAEFAAGVGHELNNPLAVIGGRVQLMLKNESQPQRCNDLADIYAQVLRAGDLIADIRLFARPPKPCCKTFDLADLITRMISSLKTQIPFQEYEIQFDADSPTDVTNPWVICADEDQLDVVFRALIRNAIEAIEQRNLQYTKNKQYAQGQITVRIYCCKSCGDSNNSGKCESCAGSAPQPGLTTPQPGITVAVSDNGIGLDVQAREHLFDPYYSARQANRGLGFGLCKVYQILAAHGGRIDVVSEHGQGSVFTVWLPR